MQQPRGSELATRMRSQFRELQSRLCQELAKLDGRAQFRFDEWERPGGGGGRTAIIADGDLFEKGGVNWSAVWGELDEASLAASAMSAARTNAASPALSKGGVANSGPKGPALHKRFLATGMSLVLHARNPFVPAVHANFRYFERGDGAWFGGGSDLTPTYPDADDARHFHEAWRRVCDRHDPSYYPRFKRWCDEYFYLPHRGETRGIGGIFFDDLRGDLTRLAAFIEDCTQTVLPAYVPIAQRRRNEPYGQTELRFQALRRGRYVEFNLLYDRGTAFGLSTHGRTESILMSLPPAARWEYDWQPAPGSREAAALALFRPRDWLAPKRNERTSSAPNELTST